MAIYKISLHGSDGAVIAESLSDFADDDAAIDHAGNIYHPHEINVWEGDRLVVRFTPRRGLF